MKKERAKKSDPMKGMKAYADLLIKAALAEDVGTGDVTTGAIVGPKERGEAVFIAKEDFVVAGLFIAERTFTLLDKKIVFTPLYKDGERVKKGKVIARVEGRLDTILVGERVALNFIQRLCGIATLTARFVKAVSGANVKILDTRKTTPCMRLIEKYAVKAGGGYNHRFGLFDCVLIKDNHIQAAGTITEAVSRVNRKYKDGMLVEVEVTDLSETREAVRCGADIIMLDNMGPAMIDKALKIIDNSALVEVSGGVSLANIKEVARKGVDFISIGALTHSAPSVDISMEVVSLCGKKRSLKQRC